MMTPRTLLAALLLLVAAAAPARRRHTTATTHKLEPVAALTPAAPGPDTVVITAERPTRLRLSGYEKPLTALCEALLVSNMAAPDSVLEAFQLEIVYEDTQGRMLHRRQLWLRTDVPGGETRSVDFRSWDRQLTRYYRHGKKPRRCDEALPYDVRMAVMGEVWRRTEEGLGNSCHGSGHR